MHVYGSVGIHPRNLEYLITMYVFVRAAFVALRYEEPGIVT